MNKKETRGGTRQGSGAKPKYNEQTKTISFIRKGKYKNRKYPNAIRIEAVLMYLSFLTITLKG